MFDALRAGACGFLLKHSSEDEVVAAVRAAAAGDMLLSPSVTRPLVVEFARRRPPRWRDSAELSLLTTPEREVLDLVARRFSNADIASRARITAWTRSQRSSLSRTWETWVLTVPYEMGLVGP